MFSDIHTHNILPHAAGIIDISERVDLHLGMPDGAMMSYGIHPRTLDGWESRIPVLERLASAHIIKAVGECGLDVFSPADTKLQLQVFERQVLSADTYQLPIIVHCVRLYQDVIMVIKKTRYQLPVILHGYNGNPQITSQLMRYPNVYFSFGKPVGEKLAKSVSLISADRILVESDTDMNPCYDKIISKLADIKNIDYGLLHSMINNTFRKVIDVT